MGDTLTRWSRRASRPVQIDPTSPSSERPSPTTLEQTKQFADDIRSQVAEKSRELAEMNERLMAFGDSLLAAPGRHPCLFWQAKNASPRAPLPASKANDS